MEIVEVESKEDPEEDPEEDPSEDLDPGMEYTPNTPPTDVQMTEEYTPLEVPIK